jgi:hypothetical protein
VHGAQACTALGDVKRPSAEEALDPEILNTLRIISKQKVFLYI